MKLLFTTIIIALAFTRVNAQEKDPWTEYMTPTDVHEMLETYTGEFDLLVSMFVAEGVEPVKHKLTASGKMTLGGRFLELRLKGTMQGFAFEGITTIGYNVASGKMELTSQTNLGTGTLYLSGKFDGKLRVAQLLGELTSPINKKTLNILQQISFKNADELLIENFEGEGDNVTRSVDYLFTRKVK